MDQFKQSYQALAKKHTLPSYEELNREFELLYMREVCEIPFPLSFVRRRMNDKIGWVCNMLQSVLQPNPGSFLSMREASFFSKEHREECQALLKELMQLERLSLHLDVAMSEEQDAAFIRSAFGIWQKIKPRLQKITSQLSEGWKQDTKKENNISHYTG